MMNDVHTVLKTKKQEVEDWFESQWNNLTPLPYLSCDIRHSGHKIAVVDTNLFPAGFNNLCNAFSRETSRAFEEYFHSNYPSVKNVLIYGEEHTRNKFYLKNLRHLQRLLSEAGLRVKVGVLGQYLSENKMIIDLEGDTLELHKIEKKGDTLSADQFIPELILSNNDFASGFPEMFDGISQPIIPPAELGWQSREKQHHFRLLKEYLSKFCAQFDIDLWTLFPETDAVTEIDLTNNDSLKLLAQKIDTMLDTLHQEYEKRGIKDSPYVYIKNNRGTYGMGIVTVDSGTEILTLNRRAKNKLLSSKGNVPVDTFLIQEGIPTVDFYSGYPIEPVIYAIGKNDVGGFFRFHEGKNEYESLNSPGMAFSCLCLHKMDEPHEDYFLDCQAKQNVVDLSRFLTRVAALAAAAEAI